MNKNKGDEMKKGTKEFYELMTQFEKDLKNSNVFGHTVQRVGRDENVPESIFYHDGLVNNLFQFYMLGYQGGKLVANLKLF